MGKWHCQWQAVFGPPTNSGTRITPKWSIHGYWGHGGVAQGVWSWQQWQQFVALALALGQRISQVHNCVVDIIVDLLLEGLPDLML